MDFDFSTSTLVDKIDLVPEQFRGLYAEREGKYALQSDDPKVKGAVEAIVGLNRALKAERLAKRPTVDLSPLKEYGDSVESITANVTEMSRKLAENAKIDPKVIREQIAGQFKKDLDSRDARIASLVETLKTEMIDSRLKGAIAAAGGDVDLLLPFASKLMRTTETEGKFGVAVVDEAGNARFSGATGLPMTVNELVVELKANPKYGKLFSSEAPRGGGARPSIPNPAQRYEREVDREDMSPLEKISAGFKKRQQAKA